MAMDAQTIKLLTALKDQLQQHEDFIQRIAEGALRYGTVFMLFPDRKRVAIRSGNETFEAAQPDFPVKIGDIVTLAASGQIMGAAPALTASGPVTTVDRIVGDGRYEVKINQLSVVVIGGLFAPQPGDRVTVDHDAGGIITSILPRHAVARTQTMGVAWEDVGGLAEAKAAIEEAVIGPIQHAVLYARYGMVPPKGALLYGPPGNGKTLLAKAVAARLGDDSGMFLAIKGPEVLNMFVGETERAIREKFADARRYHGETGKPAVLFVDEAEALLSKRTNQHSSMVQQTVVPTFLAEMDGLSERSAFVILATNKPEMLDEAIVRDGRIDRKIEITRPGENDAREVLDIHLDATPVAEGIERADLIEYTVHEIYAAGRMVGTNGNSKPLAHIVSSAMLAGIVSHARASAIRRDLLSQPDRPTGLLGSDFEAAIGRIQSENCHVQHAL